MGNIILRIIVNAIAIAITAAILPGIHVANNDIGTYLVIGIVFGLVNAIVKPIVTLLTCSLVFLTLGLFILVINGLMLLLTAALIPERLTIDGFGWAVIGGIIMSIVGVAMEGALGLNKDE